MPGQVRITIVVQELHVEDGEARGLKFAKDVDATSEYIDSFFFDARQATKVIFGEGNSTYIAHLEQKAETLRCQLQIAELRREELRKELERANRKFYETVEAATRMSQVAAPYNISVKDMGMAQQPKKIENAEDFKNLWGSGRPR